MTLPFAPENDKRKYQCFVCGQLFEKFDTFKEHVKEKHREGDDFITCPLLRCGAPVRDMRVHFKVKHPGETLPKIGPLKAMIWKDFKGGKGKTRKPKFKEGYHESTKMKKQFHYRSGYEKTVYECLDLLPEVVGYDVEPFRIQYLHKGEEHEYIPDIIVTYSDGKREVWEVKPASQTILEININKWNAAARACDARGWEFIVMTEQGIEKLKNRVRRLNG
jgi:hypothetical protein